jgi:hypothetical protein
LKTSNVERFTAPPAPEDQVGDLPGERHPQDLLLVLLGEHGGLVVAVVAREPQLLPGEQLGRAARDRVLRGIVDLVLSRLVVGGDREEIAAGVILVQADDGARRSRIGRGLRAGGTQALEQRGIQERVAVVGLDVRRRERRRQRHLAAEVKAAARQQAEGSRDPCGGTHHTTTLTSLPGT